MFLMLLMFILCNLIIWKPCVASYLRETSAKVQAKIKKLAREVVLDLMMKVESIQHIRFMHDKSTAYQYGLVYYEITRTYREMTKVYETTVKDMQAKAREKNVDYESDFSFYTDELSIMDNLYHDLLNFCQMIQVYDAIMNGDKTQIGYQLFFRRKNEVRELMRMINSFARGNTPNSPPPEESTQTPTGKKKNGAWHAAPLD